MKPINNDVIRLWKDVLTPLDDDAIDHLPLSLQVKAFLSNVGVPTPFQPYLIEFFSHPSILDNDINDVFSYIAFAGDHEGRFIVIREHVEDIVVADNSKSRIISRDLPSFLLTLGRLRLNTIIMLGRRQRLVDSFDDIEDLPFDIDEIDGSREQLVETRSSPTLVEAYRDRLNTILEDIGPLSDKPPLWLRCHQDDEHCFDDLAVLRRTIWILRDLARFDPAVFDTTRDLSAQWWPRIVEEAMKGFIRTL